MAGDALLGREMGRYRVESIIGSGGFATVYRAIDLALERPVALKVVDPTAHRNPTIGRRFVLEGRAVASLDHPAIVPVFDAGENDGVLWMAMRLIPGGSLDDALVAGRRFTFEQVAAVIARIGDALDHAHGHGVVHRDVKPSNILLEHNDPGRAWLADFGIAATTRTAGRYTTGALGTAAYMAPEQARPSSVGPPADLYSLGCVAYELLTRRRPFPGDDYVELLVAHATHPVPPTPWPRVDEFMHRALAKDPTARPPSGQAFAEDLRTTLHSTPRPAASAAPLPPPPPPAASPASPPPPPPARSAPSPGAGDGSPDATPAPPHSPPAASTPGPASPPSPPPAPSAPSPDAGDDSPDATPAPPHSPPAASTPVPASPPSPNASASPPPPPPVPPHSPPAAGAPGPASPPSPPPAPSAPSPDAGDGSPDVAPARPPASSATDAAAASPPSPGRTARPVASDAEPAPSTPSPSPHDAASPAIAASPAPPSSTAATDSAGSPSPVGTGAAPAPEAPAEVPGGKARATAKAGDNAGQHPDGPPGRPPAPPPYRPGDPGRHTGGPPGRPAAPPPHRPGDPVGRPADHRGAGDETTQPAAPPTGAAAADHAPASHPPQPTAPAAGAPTDRAAASRPNHPADETTQPAAPPTGAAAADHAPASHPPQPTAPTAGAPTDRATASRPNQAADETTQPAEPPAAAAGTDAVPGGPKEAGGSVRGTAAGDGRPAPPVPAPTVVEQVDKTLEHPSLRLPPPPVHPPSGWGGAGQTPPSTPPGGLRPPPPRDPTVVRTGRRRGRQRLVAGGAVIAVGIVAATVALLDRPKEGSRRVKDRAGISYDLPRGWTSDTSQAPRVVFEEDGSPVAAFTRAPTDDGSATNQLADADPDVCEGDPVGASTQIRGAEQLAQCVNDPNDSPELPSVAIGAVAQGQFWVITVFSTASDADRGEFLGNIELGPLGTAP